MIEPSVWDRELERSVLWVRLTALNVVSHDVLMLFDDNRTDHVDRALLHRWNDEYLVDERRLTMGLEPARHRYAENDPLAHRSTDLRYRLLLTSKGMSYAWECRLARRAVMALIDDAGHLNRRDVVTWRKRTRIALMKQLGQ